MSRHGSARRKGYVLISAARTDLGSALIGRTGRWVNGSELREYPLSIGRVTAKVVWFDGPDDDDMLGLQTHAGGNGYPTRPYQW